MATQPTGYLDFSWNATPDVDGYKVKLYKNNSYYKTSAVSTQNIRVSGLIENDLIHGFAYPYKSDLIYPSFENLTPQTVPVSRFDNTFELNKLTINNRPISLSFLNNDNNILDPDISSLSTLDSDVSSLSTLDSDVSSLSTLDSDVSSLSTLDSDISSLSYLDFTHSSYGFSGQFIYTNQSNKINLSIVSPRSDEILYNFDEEPFLKSIYYDIYSSDGHLNLLESHEVNAFSFDIVNSGQYGRNFIAQISVNDFYDSGITGNINFINEPIYINSISINHSGSENQATLNILSSYTKECTKIDYLVYDNNDCTGSYLFSGTPESVNDYDIDLDLDFSGALKIIPHDLYGTGYEYISKDLHFADLSTAETFNEINNHYIDAGSSYSTYNIYAEKTNVSDSGSYFEISIDSGINSNFDQDSFFTGRFDDISSGYSFDFFPFIDPFSDSIQYFYASLNLYQSGTAILEDSVLTSGSLLAPRFYSSGVNFDYVNGLTTLSFDMNPKLSYSGINLMVSGKNDLTYNDYFSLSYEVSDLYPHLGLRIVDSANPDIIYDEIEVTGSGNLPSISVSEADFITADGMKGIVISNNNSDVTVNQVRSYGRFSFAETSADVDTLGQEYNDILAFNDYLSFEEEVKYIGNNLSVGPSGLTRNINYTIPGSTASFESGLHYMHRFIPENGYGTGSVTEVFYIEYPVNSFGSYMDNNQQITDQSISDIQSNFASQSYVNSRTTSTSSHVNAGSYLNLDTSNDKNFIIDNNNQTNLYINFQNISELFFNTSIFIFNGTNLSNITFQVNGSAVSAARTLGSYSSSYNSLDINIASFSNNWYITNRIN